MIIKEIVNRRSIKRYKTDQVPDELIEDIIKAAQFAPTAVDNRAVEFIVIKDQKIKDSLDKILQSKQDYVRQAPVIIVPVTDTTKSYLAVQDLSVASENMFLQATALGLGTVWKNVKPEPAIAIKSLLNLPDRFTLVNIIPVGYAAEKLEPHSDSEFRKEKIHYEKFETYEL